MAGCIILIQIYIYLTVYFQRSVFDLQNHEEADHESDNETTVKMLNKWIWWKFALFNLLFLILIRKKCSEWSKKVKPNIFVYFIQHLPNFPGQEGQFLCSLTKENGQLKSLLSGRLHMSNWFSVQSWMDLVYVFQLGWKMLEEETFYKSEVHEAVKAKNPGMISHDVLVK